MDLGGVPSTWGEQGTGAVEVTVAKLNSCHAETKTLGRMSRSISGQSKSYCKIAVVRNVKLWREQRVTGFCKEWIWCFVIVGW